MNLLFRSLYVCLFACIWLSSAAQSLAIPSSWQNTTSDLGRYTRENLAYGAASVLLPLNPTGFPLIEDICSSIVVLTSQDYYSGNSTWNSTVLNNIPNYYENNGLDSNFYNDAVYWALTYFYAFRTYNQNFLLDLALAAYNSTYTGAYITPQDAATATGAGRAGSFVLPAGCNIKSTAGGVFVDKGNPNSTTINSVTTTAFMALSAYLYEQTHQPFYRNTAQLSLNFILNNLWNGTIVFDNIDLSTCEINKAELTINQAWFVEGLAVWANVTKNATLTALLETVVSQVTTYSAWSSENGVISETQGGEPGGEVHKGSFIRGLVEARARNPGTALAQYIESYVTVQFNSLLNNALAPNTNFYTTAWLGPPNSTFNALGNIAALDVLNAAFNFTARIPPTGSSTPTATSSSSSNTIHARSHIGAIAGGIAGGGVVIAFAVAYLSWRRRQRRRARHKAPVLEERNESREQNLTPGIEPYLFYAPTDGQVSSPTSKHSDGNAFPTMSMIHPTQLQRVNRVLQDNQLRLPSSNVQTQPQPPLDSEEYSTLSSSSARPPPVPSERDGDHDLSESLVHTSNTPVDEDAGRYRSTRLNTAPVRSRDVVGSSSSELELRPEQPLTLADLPALARHLYTLMQDQQPELPPQYES